MIASLKSESDQNQRSNLAGLESESSTIRLREADLEWKEREDRKQNINLLTVKNIYLI